MRRHWLPQPRTLHIISHENVLSFLQSKERQSKPTQTLGPQQDSEVWIRASSLVWDASNPDLIKIIRVRGVTEDSCHKPSVLHGYKFIASKVLTPRSNWRSVLVDTFFHLKFILINVHFQHNHITVMVQPWYISKYIIMFSLFNLLIVHCLL